MNNDNINSDVISILKTAAEAEAIIKGSSKYPQIRGHVQFHQLQNSVMVIAQISGLPTPSGKCKNPVFGFHIHSGTSCTGNQSDPFANALTHYNPDTCPHPHHAGDMPPLFGNNGNAFLAFLTNRFTVKEIIGKTVIIHSNPDDFTTQPSGNSGEKIACGKITG